MADNLAAFAKNKILDHLLGRASWTMPTVWVALFNGDARAAGTEVKTPGSSGYARQQLSPNTSPASGGATANSAVLEWGAATDGTWAQVTWAALYDASNGGNLIAAVPITNKTVAQGDFYRIPVGDLDVTIP